LTISVETLKSLDNPEQWIAPGETRRVRLQTTENFIGTPVRVPVAIKRGRKPGPKVFITAALHGNEIVSVEIPASVELTITETEPGVQGDRVSGARKPATLETGKTIQVPLFVEIGDRVKVDTRSGDYITRV
jgi:hypothetical protein